MSPAGLGALVGLAAGLGAMLVVSGVRRGRQVRLADRLGPYLRDTATPSRPLGRETAGTRLRAVLPVLAAAVGRAVGGARSVRRRLAAVGSTATVEEFRVEQVVWGGFGLVAGAGAAGMAALVTGAVPVLAAALLPPLGATAGVLGRDWWLARQVRRREEALLHELPEVAELLALAVTAGESAQQALERVCRISDGVLAAELGRAVAEARAGSSLTAALAAVGDRTSVGALARFVDGFVVALERGTPLAEVLRAQATDAREAGKRALLASGGRREIAMLVPVVFGVLPVTVLFALFPGLVAITLLTR